MNKFSLIFSIVVLASICYARYLPKPEFVKNTSKEWTETAKKLGWSDEQTAAVVDLMQFIHDREITSAEVDTNTEWKKSMVDKCKTLANFDPIDEMTDHVGDKKWSEVKSMDFSAKLEFWNDKYTKWDCEEGKMKALKNMCIVITEDEMKKHYMDLAKLAEYKENQWKPIADLKWNMKLLKSVGEQKSMLADHCEMLNDDGTMLFVNETHMANKKWSEVKEQDISTKLNFWWDMTITADCEKAQTKSLKNFCVEFLCPDERKKIENWAKEAGIQDGDLKAVVDLEMRMLTVAKPAEARDITMMKCKDLGSNKYMMEPTMSHDDVTKLKELENADWVARVHFWAGKYRDLTGADHMKPLKNICVIIMEEKEKKNE